MKYHFMIVKKMYVSDHECLYFTSHQGKQANFRPGRAFELPSKVVNELGSQVNPFFSGESDLGHCPGLGHVGSLEERE
jgi:hypothetical protein